MSEPKILTLDIETSPNLSWHFGMHNVNISPVQLVEPSRTICFAAKWLSQRPIQFSAEWDTSHSDMLEVARRLLDEADVVVTYNGDGFDLPRLEWGFRTWDIERPSPYLSVDLYKVIKRHFKSGPPSKKLGYITSELGLTGKLDTGGYWPMWLGLTQESDPRLAAKFRRLIRRYNKQDVRTTEELFLELRNLVTLPHLSLYLDDEDAVDGTCPQCMSDEHVSKQGFSYTKQSKFQQYVCRSCGRWFKGTKSLARVSVV